MEDIIHPGQHVSIEATSVHAMDQEVSVNIAYYLSSLLVKYSLFDPVLELKQLLVLQTIFLLIAQVCLMQCLSVAACDRERAPSSLLALQRLQRFLVCRKFKEDHGPRNCQA